MRAHLRAEERLGGAARARRPCKASPTRMGPRRVERGEEFKFKLAALGQIAGGGGESIRLGAPRWQWRD